MTETPPDPADVHTGTDRVELTKDERLKIGAEVAGFLAGTRIVGPDLAMQSVTPGLARAVESIVAARLQALAAELRQSATVELTRVHQELASANARCAELEESTGFMAISDLVHKCNTQIARAAAAEAKNVTLQATLDRVTAPLTDDDIGRIRDAKDKFYDDTVEPNWHLIHVVEGIYEARAALTPEGTE